MNKRHSTFALITSLILATTAQARYYVNPLFNGYSDISAFPTNPDDIFQIGAGGNGHFRIDAIPPFVNLQIPDYPTHIGINSEGYIGILDITGATANMNTRRVSIGSNGTLNIDTGGSLSAASTLRTEGSINLSGFSSLLQAEYLFAEKGNANISSSAYMLVRDLATIGTNELATYNITGSKTHFRANTLEIGSATVFENQLGHGIINLQQGAQLTIDDSASIGHYGFANGVLNIESAAKMTVANNLYLGETRYEGSPIGTLNITDSNTLLTSENLYLGYVDRERYGITGNGRVNITNKANVQILETTYVGYSQFKLEDNAANGILDIKDKESSLDTLNIVNGYNATGHIQLEQGGKLNVQNMFHQNTISATQLTLSEHYQTQRGWAIETLNASLAGTLHITNLDTNKIELNQIYKLMEIDGFQTGHFKDLLQDDIVATIDDLDIFISYTGGDGNDIILYTNHIGDANADQITDHQDLDLVRKKLGSNSIIGDADHDGDTDLADLFAVRNNFTTSTTTIPEPASITLLSLALLTITKRKNR